MKKKILFVINTMGRAGAENAMAALIRQLDRNRYEVHLYALIGRGEVFKDIPDWVVLHNQKPDSRPVLGKGGQGALLRQVLKSSLVRCSLIKNLPYMLHNLRLQKKRGKVQPDKLCWRLISDGAARFSEHFDLAVAFLEGGSAYYVAEHVKAAKKCAFIHIDYKMAGYHPEFDRGCYDRMDRIFAVSEEARRVFLKVYPKYREKMFLFHNIMDVKRIERLAFEGEGFTDGFEGIRLLTVGRLHPQKAFDNAVLILKKLKEKKLPVRWYVIGEGSERENLTRLIAEQEAGKDFILLGAKENPYPFIRQCDIYVHETRFEGKSIAVAEAQILKKPVVASRCTGNEEQIKHGVNGILTELDPDSAAEGIARMIEDKTFRESCIREEEKLDFTAEKDIALLLDLIQ